MGTGDGHLYVFENGATVLTRTVKAHTGSVYTLHRMAGLAGQNGSDEGGNKGALGFWSGGKDGLVKFYDNQVRRKYTKHQ